MYKNCKSENGFWSSSHEAHYAYQTNPPQAQQTIKNRVMIKLRDTEFFKNTSKDIFRARKHVRFVCGMTIALFLSGPPEVWAQNGIVEGTAGNDIMALGFTDADGDQVTAGADIIEGLDGDDTFRAEDDEAHGDTLRGGTGIDRLQNAYAGTASGGTVDLQINTETTLDSVEIIDGSAGSTPQNVTLDGNGTFDLSSVTNVQQVTAFNHSADTGSLTVMLPNLVDNGTFDLNDGEDVAADIQMGLWRHPARRGGHRPVGKRICGDSNHRGL